MRIICGHLLRCPPLPEVAAATVLSGGLVPVPVGFVPRIWCNLGHFSEGTPLACTQTRANKAEWTGNFTCAARPPCADHQPRCTPTRTSFTEYVQKCNDTSHIYAVEPKYFYPSNWQTYTGASDVCQHHGAVLPAPARITYVRKYRQRLTADGAFSGLDFPLQFWLGQTSGDQAVTSLRALFTRDTLLPVVCEFRNPVCGNWFRTGKKNPQCVGCLHSTWYNRKTGHCEGPNGNIACGSGGRAVFVPLNGTQNFIPFGTFEQNRKFCDDYDIKADVPTLDMRDCVSRLYRDLAITKGYPMLNSAIWVQPIARDGTAKYVKVLQPKLDPVDRQDETEIATFACAYF